MNNSKDLLDSAFIDQLKAGDLLSKSQLTIFLKSTKKKESAKQIFDAFKSNPEGFLRSISASLDTQDFLYRAENVTQVVGRIERLISPEITEVVVDICGANLKEGEVPSHFFLALYSTFVVKRKHNHARMIPVLLSFMDIPEIILRDLSIFSLIWLIRAFLDTEQYICEYLSALLETEAPKLSRTSFLILSKSLETFFAVLPDSMTKIYVSSLCKDAFLYQGLLLKPENDTQDLTTAEQLLRVVSSSGVNESARNFSTKNYLSLLIAGIELDYSVSIRALSLLCIVKLWNFSAIEKQVSMESVLEKSLSSFVFADPNTPECNALLEALAYLSLGGAPKTVLRANETAVEQLVLILETSSDPSAIYGCVSVISNLCRLRRADQYKDTASLNYLETMSAAGKSMGGKPIDGMYHDGKSDDDETKIAKFNELLVVTHKLVGTLTSLKSVKDNSAVLIVDIIHSLTIKQDLTVLRAIVAQGGMNTIIKYLTEHSKVSKESSSTIGDSEDEMSIEIRLCALRVLATLARTVNPSLAFSKFDIKTTVPFLVELLGAEYNPDADVPFLVDSKLTPADKLCSLLALTNLSSLSDADLHASIIRRTFEPHLKSLMLETSLYAVQKAAWELINNLIVNPMMLAKFFNPDSPESRRNLDILVKMLHSESEPLQVVIAGLLANATMEFDLVSISIITQKEIFANLRKIIASIFLEQTQNDDLLVRVLSVLQSVSVAARNSRGSALEVLRNDETLKKGIKAVAITTKDADVISLLREVIEI